MDRTKEFINLLSSHGIQKQIVQETGISRMIKLIDLSRKTMLKTEELGALESNTAQFIQSSFLILDNMRAVEQATEMQRVHSENVLYTLDKLLSKLVSLFKEYEEKKLGQVLQQKSHLKQRNVQHTKSTAYPFDATVTELSPTGHGPSTKHDVDSFESHQLDVLEREKTQMQLLYNKELEEVVKIEETLLQISNMQSVIEEQIAIQADKIESIYDATWEIQATVRKGNEQLVKAKRHSSDFRFFLTVFLLVAALSLVFLNWYK